MTHYLVRNSFSVGLSKIVIGPRKDDQTGIGKERQESLTDGHGADWVGIAPKQQGWRVD